MVVDEMKLKLNKHWTTGEKPLQWFNTSFLRHSDKLNEFKITLNNKTYKIYSKQRNLPRRTSGKG
ncbi:unnamed protein product [Schistosoma margrebowiei]|uniref:Uncharacterized protein n=1 Tax=Schistosoma margrebowiei TaxID=48269 RepID=A0A3P7WU00_9TREM|nr:unnamed protein product [Schistosoma margrebowiei]